MASAPPLTPTPYSRFLKNFFASEFASLAKFLTVSLLKTSTTEIEPMPPLSFNNFDGDALQGLAKQFRENPAATYVHQLSQYCQSIS